MIRNSFYGDETRWWYGVIVNVSEDPLQLGRAMVRIYGIHGPDISDDQLPWAAVLLPTTSGGISGIGTSPWLQPNAKVMGLFLDGVGSQNPIIIGAIGAVEGEIPRYGDNGYVGTGPSGEGGGIAYGESGTVTRTNYIGTNTEARELVEDVFRPMTDEEFRSMMALISAEAGIRNGGGNQQEMAWVAKVILNRATKRGRTIMQIANERYQFHSATGPRGDGSGTWAGKSNYVNGPSATRANRIFGALDTYLATAPNNVYCFDANNPAAYAEVGGVSKYNSVARDRRAAGLTLRVIGESRFWIGEGGY